MNYKKSILSLVTIMALSGTALADGSATYLPLTSDDYDSSWTLFGVNGFSDGTPSARGNSSDGFSADFVSITEAVDDKDATSGLTNGNGDMMSVQAVDHSFTAPLQVAAKIEHPYEKKEPVRSMYIRLNSSTPNVKLNYKASMEDQRLELIPNGGSTLYYVTIDEDNTYANAAIASLASAAAATTTKLSNIVDVLDYNFLNNPIEAKYFSKSAHLETATDMVANGNTAKTAIFYHFDSISEQWKVWDKDFTANGNDFTAFEKGNAYWGLIDTDDDSASLQADGSDDNVTASGLILGTSGENATSTSFEAYQNDPATDGDVATKLRVGWNMLALDDAEPYVRRAATGIIATFNIANNDGTIIVTDSSGQHPITIDINTTTTQNIANEINQKIEREKLLRNIPSSVNIKAFRSGAGNIAFISDAKFTLTDGNDKDNIEGTTTLTGLQPYNGTGIRTSVSDLNASSGSVEDTYVTSVYGEYALIIDLLVSDLMQVNNATNDTKYKDIRVAADLDAHAKTALGGGGSAGVFGSGDHYSAAIKLGTSAKSSYAAIPLADHTAADQAATFVTAKASVVAHDIFSGTDGTGILSEIDTNGNGFSDRAIIASNIPFYIADNTFTRVFTDINATNDGIRTFSAVGKNTVSIKPLNTSSAVRQPRATAALINAVAELADGDTGIFADVNSSIDGKLIAVSTSTTLFDLKDFEDGDHQFLVNSSESSALAKGAVAGVYALDTVARLPLVLNTIKFTDFNVSSDDTTSYDNNITLTINTLTESFEYNITDSRNGRDSEANITAYFDSIVTQLNTLIQEQNGSIHAYAYHTYVDGTTDAAINDAEVIIRGLDVEFNTTIVMDSNDTRMTDPTSTTNVDRNTTATTSVTTPGAKTLGNGWTSLVADLKSNAIYTPDYASYGPLYAFNNAGYDVRSILKATTQFSDETIAWDGIDLTRDEDDWLKNNEFNLFSSNIHAGYWVYLVTATFEADSVEIKNASFTPTYTYYFDTKDTNGDYPTTNVINGGQFSVEIDKFGTGVTNAYVSVDGTEIQLKQSGSSTEYTADFTSYSLPSFTEGSGAMSFTVRATDGKGEDKKVSDLLSFDYEKPVLSAPTTATATTVKFSADSNASDLHTFHVFKDYIPEKDASRSSSVVATNRLIGSYAASATGEATVSLCTSLDFGDADNLRIVGADGNSTNAGTIGYANVSDALEFMYIASFKGSHVLRHVGGVNDKAIIGTKYGSDCIATGEVLTPADNTGVSLKSLTDGKVALLAYQEVTGTVNTLAAAWTSQYSIGGSTLIQIQNIEEYAGKVFYLEYDGKMYRSAFPTEVSDSVDSHLTAIELDASGTFSLDSNGERDKTGGSSTGEALPTVLNDTLEP